MLDSVANTSEPELDELCRDFDAFSRNHRPSTVAVAAAAAQPSERTKARRRRKFAKVSEEVSRYDTAFESLDAFSHRPIFGGPESGLSAMGSEGWSEEIVPEEPHSYRPIFVCSKNPSIRVASDFALSQEGHEPLPVAGAEDIELQVILGEEITRDEKYRVLHRLAKYADVFQRPPGPWIPSDLEPFEIDTGNEKPVFQRANSIPFNLRAFARTEIEFLLRKGIIRRSNSQWQSRWLLVPRPDGRYRCCLDARALNKKSAVMGGQLPLINDLLDSLQGKMYWSQLDLEMGYAQCKLTERSKSRTSFACFMGKFEYEVLPFGVQAAPGYFQEQMRRVLEGLPNVILFIDDILIASDSLEQHFRDIEAVFERLKRHKLIAKVKKCTFLLSKIIFLGHEISRAGVSVSAEKASAVTNIQTPKTSKQVLQALGLLGWFRRFIFQYGALAAPLYALTSKDAEFVWSPECESAFSELKNRLVSAPVLKLPDFNGSEFILQVDASGYGIGGVLLQANAQGVLQPVCFVSTKLGKHADAWHVREREAYAIVWSIIKLRYYLIGRHFTVETDHKSLASLAWVLNQDSCNRLTRWSLLLSAYNFSVKAIKGVTNVISDRLSRLPNSQPVSQAVFSVTISPMSKPVCVLTPSYDEWNSSTSRKLNSTAKPGNALHASAVAVDESDEIEEEKETEIDAHSLPTVEELAAAQRADPLLSQLLRRFQGLPAPEPEVDRLLAEARKNKGEYSASGLLEHSSPNIRVLGP